MQIAVSCALLAMFSQRALLVDESVSHWLPAAQWPFDQPKHTDIRWQAYAHLSLIKSLPKEKALPTGELSCFDWLEDQTPLVSSAGNRATDYFGSLMMVNPYHRLWQRLPVNWFQLVFDTFFPLQRSHRALVDDYKRANFSTHGYTIGIQIRTKVPTPNDAKHGDDHWFSPPLADAEVFFQAAEMLSHQAPIAYQHVTWFIATQNESLVEWFRQRRAIENQQLMFGNDGDKKALMQVVWLPGKVTYSYENDIEGKLSGTWTWLLLSECQDIIATDFSSYGQTAAARGGNREKK
jgi:hypothetical protein